MDCMLPSTSGHGIYQARILGRVAISFCGGASQTSNWIESPPLQVDSLLLSHLVDSFFFFFWGGEFCHTLKWNNHGFTCVPYPDPPSHLPLHPLPLGFPSAPSPSACLMHPTWAGDLSVSIKLWPEAELCKRMLIASETTTSHCCRLMARTWFQQNT